MARERTYRADAVILRRSDFGEADRLLTLFSREQGKLRAIAKGARKPQSRKTGHVELYMRTRFLIAKGRDIDIVTQAEVVEVYRGLRDDLVRATYAAYVAELLDKLTADEDTNRALFDLLVSALGWLETAPDVRLVARFYEMRLLSLTGFQPQLFRCVVSGDDIKEEDQYFSLEMGGLINAEHAHADRRARPITAVAVKVLRFLQSRSWDTVHSLTLKPTLHRELEGHMHAFLSYALERSLKSVEFLDRLRTEAALFTTEVASEERLDGDLEK